MNPTLFNHHFMVKNIRGRNEYDIYKNYINDLPNTVIADFLSELFQSHRVKEKNDVTSLQFRKHGNDVFKSSDYKQSLKIYTKSLCYATYNSEAYATTLANRSAVFFKLNDYESCIKDINLCLEGKYPVTLKPKVCIRKAECYKKLGEALKMRNMLMDILNLVDSMPSLVEPIAENYRKAVKELRTQQVDVRSGGQNCSDALPTLEPNPSFLNASSSIELQYNKNSGARVVAKKQIARGDVLFVEKAYAFGHFNNAELPPLQCQNCLVIIASCVPCKGCVEHIYCTEKCRDSAWNDFHQWECVGVQARLFVVLLDCYLALRIIFKGLHTGLSTVCINFEDAVNNGYGSMDDNYPYVHSLPTNIEKIDKDQLMVYAAGAAVAVSYLKSKTDFFSHLKKWPVYENKSNKELMNKVGGLIIRHCAQLQCHEIRIPTVMEKPIRTGTVGGTVCPSMSMINHSCVPNTAHHFVGDTVVVKALDNIKPNEEICRAYLDIKFSSEPLTIQRQMKLEQICSLKCKCRACSDKRMSIEGNNAYFCITCNGPAVFEKHVGIISKAVCLECNYQFAIPPEVLIKERQFIATLKRFATSRDIKDANWCLQIAKTIFKPFHESFRWLYQELSIYYLERGDIKCYMEIHKLIRDIKDNLYSSVALENGFERYVHCKNCIELLKNLTIDRNLQLGNILDKLTTIVNEAKLIMELHYPPFLARLEQLENTISELRMLNIMQRMDNI